MYTLSKPTINPDFKPAARLPYIDNLRGVAMLLGVFVHTATLETFGTIEMVSWLSDLFRMAAFFLISGYLAAMLLARRTVSKYYRSRIPNILVPLISGIILLNPVTLSLILQHHNPEMAHTYSLSQMGILLFKTPGEVDGPMIWHLHLWFLFSLLAFTLLAPLAERVIYSNFIRLALTKVFRRMPEFIVPTGIATMISGAVLLLRVFYELVISPVADYWLILITFEYFPFFVAGIVFYCYQGIWEQIHKIDLPLFVVSISLYCFVSYLPDATRDAQTGEALYTFSQALLRCAIVFALLTVFRTYVNWSSHLTLAVTEAIYTVYVFHFLVIYLVAVTLIDTSSASISSFFIVSGVTLLITFVLHHFLVKRSRVLRFLFNGRWDSLSRK